MANRKKIAVMHVVDSFSLGGKERLAVDFINGLNPDVFEKSISSTREEGPLLSKIDSNIPVLIFNRKSRFDLKQIFLFATHLTQNRIRIVHTHGYFVTLFVALIKILFYREFLIIMHGHNPSIWFTQLPVIHRIWHRLILRSVVNGFVGVDEKNVDWAISQIRLSSSNVRIIPHRIKVERFSFREKTNACSQSRTQMILVGNFREEKNHLMLLEALTFCQHKQDISITLVTCKKAYESNWGMSLMSAIRESSYRELIEILIDVDDIPRILPEYDLGLMISNYESGPLVLAEYMAAGLPFVATEVGEIAVRAKSSDAGIFIQPGDVTALAHAIDSFVEMSAYERKKMSENAFHFARRHFDFTKSLDELTKFYYQILKA